MSSFSPLKGTISLFFCLLFFAIVACDLSPDIPCEKQEDCTPPTSCFHKRCLPKNWIDEAKRLKEKHEGCKYCPFEGEKCVDITENKAHCGECNVACHKQQLCEDKACHCGYGLTLCPQGCVNLDSSNDNCGTCNNRCGSNQHCYAGKCIDKSCKDQLPPLEKCGNSCVKLQIDPNHCGKCGNRCTSDQICLKGKCACAPNQKSCDDRCVDTQVDFRHCGGCGKKCPAGEVCASGRCQKSCPSSTPNNCYGGCFDSQVSSRHCGSCGNRCPAGFDCIQGECACRGVEKGCGSPKRCVDLKTDWSHCGRCDKPCDKGRFCSEGKCLPTCPNNTSTPCFGGCYNLQLSNTHCGACGNACAKNERCGSGKCVPGPREEQPQSIENTPETPQEIYAEVAPEAGEQPKEKVTPEPTTSEVTPEEKPVVADERVKTPEETAPPAEKVIEKVMDAGEPILEKKPDTCQPSTTPELCNGQDDNCDGSIDENLSRPCYTGPKGTENKGLCKGSTQKCVGSQWELACTGEVKPKTEVCDGKDNNCDGNIDEGNPGGGGTCSTGKQGICSPGKDTCVGGNIICKADKTSTTESCNNKDDDCDGLTDEHLTQPCYTGPKGTEGKGLCKGSIQKCVSGKWEQTCVGEVKPTTEVCDGKDNNCDGSVDEGNLTQSCYTGPTGTENKGLCKSGSQKCVNGKWDACTGDIKPTAEDCNGKDDDCDGSVDENLSTPAFYYTGPAKTKNVGECKEGRRSCSSGKWSYQPKEVTPTTETCGSAKDFNCDGKTNTPCVWAAQSIGASTKTYGQAVIEDGKGNVYIAGFNEGAAFSFGGTNFNNLSPKKLGGASGQRNFFVMKLNKSGKILWFQEATYGIPISVPTGNRTKLLLDRNGNLIVAGLFSWELTFKQAGLKASINTDIFVLKIDTTGKILWLKAYKGSHNIHLGSATIDDKNDIYITGSFGKTITIDSKILTHTHSVFGTQATFFAKISSQGKVVWAKKISYDHHQSNELLGVDIHFTKSGKLYLLAKLPEGPQGTNLQLNSKITITIPQFTEKVLVARLDKNGSYIWAKAFGPSTSTAIITPNRFAFDSNDNIYILGTYRDDIKSGTQTWIDKKVYQNIKTGGSAIMLLKLDSSGKFIFGKNLGWSTKHDFKLTSIVTDKTSDNIYLGGHYRSTTSQMQITWVKNKTITSSSISILLAKMNKSGQFQSILLKGGSKTDTVESMHFGNSKVLRVIGSFSSNSIVLGSTTLKSSNLTQNFYLWNLIF